MLPLKSSVIVLLFSVALLISSCSSKPYGHYRDNQMIGFIDGLDEQEQTVRFNISEWTKRDERGPDIEDWGAEYEARVLGGTTITNEAGEKLGWVDLKRGQKVQINPPSTKVITDTPDELIILSMPNEELLMRAGLLASRKGQLRTTVVYGKGESQPYPLEAFKDEEAEMLLNGGYSWLEHDPAYVMDVQKAFRIEAFPVFLVFDTETLVLKSERLEDVLAFKKERNEQ